MRTTFALFVAAMSLVAIARADVDSGPTVGEAVPKLKVHVVVGDAAGKELDVVAERKDAPTVYLLVERTKWNRPMARFMKELDGKIAETAKQSGVVAVWLTDELEKTKEYLPIAQTSLGFQNTTLAAVNGTASPEGWGVNSSADLTVVIVLEKKVVARFGFVSVNDTLVRQVLAALKKPAK